MHMSHVQMKCCVSSRPSLVPNPLFSPTLPYSAPPRQTRPLRPAVPSQRAVCMDQRPALTQPSHDARFAHPCHACDSCSHPALSRAAYQAQSQIWFWNTKRVSVPILIVPPGTRGRPAPPEMVTVWSGSTLPKIGALPQNVISYLTGRQPDAAPPLE